MPSFFSKDPNEVLDYQIDWEDWLNTDTILTSSWSISPTGLTEDSDSNSDTTATIWVSGGTEGEIYTLTNQITTDGGRTAERSIVIYLTDK